MGGLLLSLIAILFLGYAPQCSAQLAFRTTAGDTSPSDLYYLHEKQDVLITVQQDLKSVPYPVKVAGPLDLYTLSKTSDGKINTNPVASVDLTSQGSLPLLMFFHGISPSAPYRIVVMKEDALSFPGGSCRFVNNATVPVRVMLGKDTFVVPPQGVVSKPNPSLTAQVNLSSSLSGYPPVTWFTQNMLLEPQRRYLFVMLPDSQSRSGVSLRMLGDGTPH